jgi:hypothetical protein
MPPLPPADYALATDLTAATARITVLEALVAQLRQQIDWITSDLRSHKGGYASLSPQPSGW